MIADELSEKMFCAKMDTLSCPGKKARTTKYPESTRTYIIMIPNTAKDAMYVYLEPLGLLPRARMNCKSKNDKYRYFKIVLIIGVAVSPKGQP
jgi:hypothetical protein